MTAMQSRVLKLVLAAGVVIVLAVIAILGTIRYIDAKAAEETKACNQERQNLQRALNAYMADKSLASVPTSDGTDNMTAPVLLYNRHPTATDQTFIATSRTRWAYGWNSKGTITIIETGPSGHYVPVGCKPDGV